MIWVSRAIGEGKRGGMGEGEEIKRCVGGVWESQGAWKGQSENWMDSKREGRERRGGQKRDGEGEGEGEGGLGERWSLRRLARDVGRLARAFSGVRLSPASQ